MNRKSKVRPEGISGNYEMPSKEKLIITHTPELHSPYSAVAQLRIKELATEQKLIKDAIIGLLNQGEVIPERLLSRYNNIFLEVSSCKRRDDDGMGAF
jgi:hypothetical protein